VKTKVINYFGNVSNARLNGIKQLGFSDLFLKLY